MKKSFWQKIREFLMRVDAKASYIFQLIQDKYGERVVKIMEEAKPYIESKDVEGFVKWTKTPTDDIIYNGLKKVYAQAVIELGYVRGVIASTDNYALALTQIFDHITKIPANGKGSWWREIPALAVQILKDGRIDWNDFSTFIAGIYAIYLKIKNSK